MRKGDEWYEYMISFRGSVEKQESKTMISHIPSDRDIFKGFHVKSQEAWEKVVKFCKENNIGNPYDPIKDYYDYYSLEEEWNQENKIKKVNQK